MLLKCKTSKEVWNLLMNIYMKLMLKQEMFCNKKLFTLKKLEEDRIANHVNTFRTLIDNLARKGTNISGNESAIVLLGSLP
jgi:hypothetical protein